METESFLKAATAVLGNQDGQAEVVASTEPAAESQASAEIAVDTPAPATEAVTEPVTQVTEPVTTTTNEPYNYWVDLEQKTGGAVKDEETLTSLLERSKNYDTVLQEKAELEKNQFKPANDYIAKFNEIVSAGATPDQAKAFVKLNEYGNLDDLNPSDAKVAKMVLLDGYSENVARKIVNSEFDTSTLDENDPEDADKILIMKEKLRVSAKSDLEALKDYRKDLSVVHNPEKEAAETAKLQEIAKLSTYNKTVESEASNIAKNFPNKLNYDFKIGDETIKYEDSIEQDFLQSKLAPLVADYFKDSLDPINQETIGQAYSFAFGEYLKQNDSRRLEKAYSKGFSEGQERTVNKYENRSGLPRAEENLPIATSEDALATFMKGTLLGK